VHADMLQARVALRALSCRYTGPGGSRTSELHASVLHETCGMAEQPIYVTHCEGHR
jgi:hypothetical protein